MSGALARLVAGEPDRAALVDDADARVATFAELRARACDRSRAISPASCVLIRAENSADFVAWFLAALAAGAWAVPVHPSSPAFEVESIASRVRPNLGVGVRAAGVRAVDLAPVPSSPAPQDGARSAEAWGGGGGVILQSSGTTGAPKLVRRGLRSLEAVADNVRASVGLRADDVVAGAIPLGHSYGMENAMLAPLSAGACVRVFRAFDPSRAWRALGPDPFAISVFPGVPFFFESITHAARLDASVEPRTLRAAYSAGTPLPRRVAREFAGRVRVRLGQLFGTTEVGSVTFAPGSPVDGPDPGVGVAMPGVSIRLLDGEGRDVPRGEEGEIAVRAPSMFEEFVAVGAEGGEEPAVTPDGHFRTGDLGRIDARGGLHVTGRLKLIVDVGGLKVNPGEVEEALLAHPGVRECVVLPAPASETVTRLRAVLVPEGVAPDPAELREFLRRRLAPHKIPRLFECRGSLPRSSTGKILRRQLLEAT